MHSVVDAFALTSAEQALLRSLNEHQVRYLVVGLSAAVLQGAPVSTQDIDLWVGDLASQRFRDALKAAGAFWVPGSGLQPPMMGGAGVDRLDIVITAHGLSAFDVEYANAIDYQVDGIPLKALSLERIIASKRSANRAKDRAALPALEAALAARDRRDGR